MENNNLTPNEYYKLANIEKALFPILPNSRKETIKSIARDELTQRIDKKNIINEIFKNTEFQTRDDRDLCLHSRIFSPWISIREWDMEIINRIDWTYHNTITETITPKDVEEIETPTCIKLENNKLEILPIKILWKNIWQVSIVYRKSNSSDNDWCFYICLSDEGKIQVIANKDWYLSGNFNKIINNYSPEEPLYVKLVPFTGKITNIKRWWTDVFTPDETKVVDINVFLDAK